MGTEAESQLELYTRLAKLLAQVAARLVRQQEQPQDARPEEQSKRH